MLIVIAISIIFMLYIFVLETRCYYILYVSVEVFMDRVVLDTFVNIND